MPLNRTASRFLVPLGTLAALGVAVGVWVVPSSVLDPKPPQVQGINEEVPAMPEIPTQTVPDRDTWMAVAAKLETLREPDPETEKEPEPEPEPDPDPDTTGGENTSNTVPPPIRLNWQYDGMVVQPRGVAALIRIGGVQKFVFEGEQLDQYDDASIPPNVTVVLHQVKRDQIIVHVGEGEQTIDRTDAAPPTRAPGPADPSERRRS